MARAKDELKQLVLDLCKEKNFSPEMTEVAVGVITGDAKYAEIAPAVAPLIDLAVGRHADYSRLSDAAKTEMLKARQIYAQNEAWRQQEAIPAVKRAQEQAAALQAKIAKFQERYGDLEDVEDIGGGRGMTASGKVVSMEMVEKLKEEAVQSAKSVMAKEFADYERDRNKVIMEHAKLFKGEIPDVNLLLDTIGEAAAEGNPNMGLLDAYNKVYGPKIAEINQAAHDAEIKAAEQRGEQRGRAAAAGVMTRSGAAIPENTGEFWSHMSTIEKQGDKPAAQLSEAERAAAFGADLSAALAANEQSTD